MNARLEQSLPKSRPALADPRVEDDTRAPGSGEPDEQNGVCRLFAPELRQPRCCERETGFDASLVQRACALPTYLGESFQHSCGYFYNHEGAGTAMFRVAFVPGATVAEAAKSHDRQLRKASRDPNFASRPMAEIPEVLWSTYRDWGWAFIPGWSAIRQFTWQRSHCNDEGVRTIIRSLLSAKQPAQGTPRQGLIPIARN